MSNEQPVEGVELREGRMLFHRAPRWWEVGRTEEFNEFGEPVCTLGWLKARFGEDLIRAEYNCHYGVLFMEHIPSTNDRKLTRIGRYLFYRKMENRLFQKYPELALQV